VEYMIRIMNKSVKKLSFVSSFDTGRCGTRYAILTGKLLVIKHVIMTGA